MHLCVSALTGLSHADWLFISAVMLAARAAISRRETELDLVDSNNKKLVAKELCLESFCLHLETKAI